MLLQWGHDLAVMESRYKGSQAGSACTGFNGAMTSRSWRVHKIARVNFVEAKLQWGHDLAVMERISP